MERLLFLLALCSLSAFSQNDTTQYTREWGIYFSVPKDMAVDMEDNLWMVFDVHPNDQADYDMLVTSDAHQAVFGGGGSDGFIAKFSSGGNLVYASYFGGEGNEYIHSLAVENGQVYILGDTQSTQNIATQGSFQETLLQNIDPNGDPYSLQAGFLAKFDTAGLLEWGSYFQGNRISSLSNVAVSNSGVYVWGSTKSDNLATVGAFRETLPAPYLNTNGEYEAPSYPILAKFDHAGSLLWATYYAPDINSSYSISAFGEITLDAFDNLYISGRSNDMDGYYGTAGSHQPMYAGGGIDIFLSKFSPSGQRLWSTYYGGGNSELQANLHIGKDNFLYLSARTNSSNNIATVGAYQTVQVDDSSNNFLVKFDLAGQRQWGTYFNNGGTYTTSHCTSDNNGNVFLVGTTSLLSGTSTSGSWQENFQGGSFDIYMVKFNPDGDNLLWGSYYGGTNVESVNSEGGIVATGGNGFYISGSTDSYSHIASDDTFSSNYGGFLTKFVPCPAPVMPVAESPQTFQPGEILADLEVETVDWPGSEPILTWYTDAAGTHVLSPNTELEVGTTYYVSQSIQGCDESDLLAITVQTLGVAEMVWEQVRLYPNPAMDILYISGISGIRNAKILLYNVQGRIILSKMQKETGNETSLNVSVLESGVYFLKISDGGETVFVEQVVKK